MTVVVRRPVLVEADAAFAAFEKRLGNIVWLDSVRGDAELGRRSLLALAFGESYCVGASDVAVRSSTSAPGVQRSEADAVLHRLNAAWSSAQRRNAASGLGWVGCLSYEAAPLFDSAFVTAAPTTDSPPALWVAEVVVALQFSGNEATLIVRGDTEGDADRIAAYWCEQLRLATEVPASVVASPRVMAEPSITEATYRDAFARIKRAIECGDVYQACLTYSIAVDSDVSPAELYLALRARYGGDYSCFVRNGAASLASFSPERFLRVSSSRVIARPMKGTRRVTGDVAADDALAAELASSEKERAENIMIVDLLRNDLGRVCETGSIRVPRLFEVERYNTVMQLTSTVEGQLLAGVTPFDLLRASFPPGSMTGAPKIAACTILAGLEKLPRGLYAGSVFWLGFDGDWDFSVVIRSLQSWGGRLRWDTGGGIVADSEVEAEWAETRLKASAVLRPDRD